jgi:hypothetical protein
MIGPPPRRPNWLPAPHSPYQVIPAQAGIHAGEDGPPPFGKLRASFSRW